MGAPRSRHAARRCRRLARPNSRGGRDVPPPSLEGELRRPDARLPAADFPGLVISTPQRSSTAQQVAERGQHGQHEADGASIARSAASATFNDPCIASYRSAGGKPRASSPEQPAGLVAPPEAGGQLRGPAGRWTGWCPPKSRSPRASSSPQTRLRSDHAKPGPWAQPGRLWEGQGVGAARRDPNDRSWGVGGSGGKPAGSAAGGRRTRVLAAVARALLAGTPRATAARATTLQPARWPSCGGRLPLCP